MSTFAADVSKTHTGFYGWWSWTFSVCCFRICANIHCPYAGMSILKLNINYLWHLFIFFSTALPCSNTRIYQRWPLSFCFNDILFCANFYCPDFGRLRFQKIVILFEVLFSCTVQNIVKIWKGLKYEENVPANIIQGIN